MCREYNRIFIFRYCITQSAQAPTCHDDLLLFRPSFLYSQVICINLYHTGWSRNLSHQHEKEQLSSTSQHFELTCRFHWASSACITVSCWSMPVLAATIRLRTAIKLLLLVAPITRRIATLLLICLHPPNSLHYFYVQNIAHQYWHKKCQLGTDSSDFISLLEVMIHHSTMALKNSEESTAAVKLWD